MKNIGNKDKLVFLLITAILFVFGLEKGSKIIANFNLLDILLSGFIAFGIVAIIMKILHNFFGIWLGRKTGILLFIIIGFIVSKTIFS